MKWSWRVEGGVYVLRPEPLPPGTAEVGFAGRGVSAAASGPLGDRPTLRLGQVHGARVVRADAPGTVSDTDGAISATAGLLLTVRTADCLPVLLSSSREGIALLHAGWRGLVSGILEVGLAALGDPSRVHAILGPAIHRCCYEVGPEVAAQFPLGALLPGPGERPHLDLVEAARLRLMQAGVPSRQVAVAPQCTRCHQHLLHSSRGSGARPGRILAFASA